MWIADEEKVVKNKTLVHVFSRGLYVLRMEINSYTLTPLNSEEVLYGVLGQPLRK